MILPFIFGIRDSGVTQEVQQLMRILVLLLDRQRPVTMVWVTIRGARETLHDKWEFLDVLLWCRRCRILSISSFWPTASLSLSPFLTFGPPCLLWCVIDKFHHTHTLLPYLLLPILKFKTWKREPVQSPLSGYDAIGDVRTTNRILVAHIFPNEKCKEDLEA